MQTTKHFRRLFPDSKVNNYIGVNFDFDTSKKMASIGFRFQLETKASAFS